MIEKTLDRQIAEEVFGIIIKKDTVIHPYSTNLNYAFCIVKYHQNKGGWSTGVKAIHYPDGNLQFRAIYRLDNKISEYVANTIEEAICVAGLMVSNNQYKEYEKEEIEEIDNANTDIKTTNILANQTQHISIEHDFDIYKIFLNCLKNVKLPVGNNNITTSVLLSASLDNGLITLEDLGNILNTITKSLINELDIYNLKIVSKEK